MSNLIQQHNTLWKAFCNLPNEFANIELSFGWGIDFITCKVCKEGIMYYSWEYEFHHACEGKPGIYDIDHYKQLITEHLVKCDGTSHANKGGCWKPWE